MVPEPDMIPEIDSGQLYRKRGELCGQIVGNLLSMAGDEASVMGLLIEGDSGENMVVHPLLYMQGKFIAPAGQGMEKGFFAKLYTQNDHTQTADIRWAKNGTPALYAQTSAFKVDIAGGKGKVDFSDTNVDKPAGRLMLIKYEGENKRSKWKKMTRGSEEYTAMVTRAFGETVQGMVERGKNYHPHTQMEKEVALLDMLGKGLNKAKGETKTNTW